VSKVGGINIIKQTCIFAGMLVTCKKKKVHVYKSLSIKESILWVHIMATLVCGVVDRQSSR